MSALKRVFFKPKWQHKDAATRARAVEILDDPELVAALPEMVKNDKSPEVRLEALKRINDFEAIWDRFNHDENSAVRDHAHTQLRAMLLEQHPHQPSELQLTQAFEKLDETELNRAVVRRSSSTQLRKMALKRIAQPGVLSEVALTDQEPEIRAAAVRKIDQQSTLERIAKQARKSDKKLYHLIQERLQAQGGDDASQAKSEETARQLCGEMETLAKGGSTKAAKQTEFDRLKQAFQTLAQERDIDAALVTRFNGASKVVELSLSPASTKRENPETLKAKAFVEREFELPSDEPESALRRLEKWLHEAQQMAAPGDVLSASVAADLDRLIRRFEDQRGEIVQHLPAASALSRLSRQLEKMRVGRTSAATLEKLVKEFDSTFDKLATPTPNDERLKRHFLDKADHLARDITAHESRQSGALDRLDADMDVLEKAIEDQDLPAAVKAKQQVLDDLKIIGKHPKTNATEFTSRLYAARGQLGEIRDWQHWANNEIRKRLCEQAEALPSSGLHPDAVGSKVKELRNRWKELDKSERLPGDRPNRIPNPAMYRRFSDALNEAFEQAKPFFEKRAELRGEVAQELESLVERAESMAAEKSSEEYKKMEHLVRDCRRSLRKVQELPPKERGKMASKLRAAADKLDARLEDQYKLVEARKERLIEEVERLTEEPDQEKAIEGAKSAQRKWKDAGSTRRNREQKLWKRFRAASDAIFNRLSEAREAERAEAKAGQEQMEKMVTELESLRPVSLDEVPEVIARMHKIEGEWQLLGANNRKLEARFQAAMGAIEEHRLNLENQAFVQQREDRWSAHLLARQLEHAAIASNNSEAEKLSQQWNDLPSESRSQQVTHRVEQALAALESEKCLEIDDTMLTKAGLLAVQAEYLAGAESPEDAKQVRMDYQVQRLADRMSGDLNTSLQDEVSELEHQWYETAPLPQDDARILDDRFWQALSAISLG